MIRFTQWYAWFDSAKTWLSKESRFAAFFTLSATVFACGPSAPPAPGEQGSETSSFAGSLNTWRPLTVDQSVNTTTCLTNTANPQSCFQYSFVNGVETGYFSIPGGLGEFRNTLIGRLGDNVGAFYVQDASTTCMQAGFFNVDAQAESNCRATIFIPTPDNTGPSAVQLKVSGILEQTAVNDGQIVRTRLACRIQDDNRGGYSVPPQEVRCSR